MQYELADGEGGSGIVVLLFALLSSFRQDHFSPLWRVIGRCSAYVGGTGAE